MEDHRCIAGERTRSRLSKEEEEEEELFPE